MIPKLAIPTFEILQPSTKKTHKFRPYLVKEEKVLLMAKQTGEVKDAYGAMTSILDACSLGSFKCEGAPLFDLEYMFLRLRGFSVNNMEKLQIKDPDDDQIFNLQVKFDAIDVVWPDPLPAKVLKVKGQRNKDITIKLKYPSADIYLNLTNDEIRDRLKSGQVFEFVSEVIDSVYAGEDLCEMTPDELKEFVDVLDHHTFKEIENFILNIPYVFFRVTYKNTKKESKNIDFYSLMHFFFFV